MVDWLENRVWYRRGLLFILLLALLPLTGCTVPVVNKEVCLPEWVPFVGGDCEADAVEEDITLTYWGLWEPIEVMQPLIDQYEQENPHITVDYQRREIQDYLQVTRNRMATDLTPDIVRLHNTWIPYLTEELSSLPQEVMTTEEYDSIFYPVTRETLLSGGSYYALPLEIDGLALVYNRSLFAKKGITAPPETWDEFKSVASRLTVTNESGEVIQSGAAMGFGESIEHFSDILGMLMAQRQIDFIDDAGSVYFHLDSDDLGDLKIIDVLDYYSHFSLQEKSWNEDWNNLIESFAQGKVAMMFVPSFRIMDVLNKNPTLQIGVARVPQLSSGSGNIDFAWATYWVEAVPLNSPHQLEAWKFLKFLTEKEQLVELFRSAEKRRFFGEPYPRKDMASLLANHQFLAPYVEQGEIYTTWNLADSTHDVQLNDVIVSSLASVIKEINSGGLSTAEAPNRLASSVSATLSAFK